MMADIHAEVEWRVVLLRERRVEMWWSCGGDWAERVVARSTAIWMEVVVRLVIENVALMIFALSLQMEWRCFRFFDCPIWVQISSYFVGVYISD